MNVSSRKIYIEWLRIIAILFVIYNHTRTWGFDLHSVTTETSSYWLSIIMVPLCKTAVPIFLMISGANLLSKQESLKELFKKRILRYVLIILLFGTLQFFRFVRTGKVPFTFVNWLKSIYTSPTIEPYWFLYLYLGFLLILPFLRKMVLNMKKSDFVYLFALVVISQTLSLIGYFSGIFANGNLFTLIGVNAFLYPLLGHGISLYGEKTDCGKFASLTFLSFFSILAASLFYKHLYPEQAYAITNLLQLFTPLLTCGIFGLTKALCQSKPDSTGKLITQIGNTVFGIYLIEDIIRNQLEKILIQSGIATYINDFAVAIIFTLFTFFIGVIVIFFVKKLPLLRKLL